ncbi:MAG: asparagine synthase (glutamine-hydrolyzing) [Actinomycetia bacterium]|nr:asparagine synthase (glutamine-hydrolyzing) [Actinomycetes bacterium]
MCGIGGWVAWDRELSHARAVLQPMADSMACRGPDAEGFFLDGPVAFAHRRLIVVDPAGGAQPMSAQRGGMRYTLVYNGELYNTDELRADLAARGHRFHGWSDTEVLLHAYMEWGPEALERLNGIFAFAVYDPAVRRVFLARDRLGVKPLFYALTPAGLVFGSEIKAVLAHPAVPREVDEEGLAEIFAIGPARTPGVGIFRSVQEVRPGWALSYGANGLRSWRYWSLESRPHEHDPAATVATVRDLLDDTVRRQLVADVPVCTLLSGGLDSTAVTALAARHLTASGRGPLMTFSVNFVDQERYFRANAFQHDVDAPWARLAAEVLGTRHHEVRLDTADLVRSWPEALVARDHPGMADIDISLLLFCREIKTHATVALSGEAADELFGGYPWCHRPEALNAGTFPWARRLADRIRVLDPGLVRRIRPHEYVAARYHDTLAEVPRLAGESPEDARIREVLYLNLTWFLPTLLDRKDRMSMASGLEVRVPFCDHRLVEYVWNVPWSLKNLGGVPKGLLREAMRGIVPEPVLARVKSPYPTTHHPSWAEAARQAMLALLDNPDSPLVPLLNVPAVRELAQTDPRAWDLPWFGQMMGVPALFVYLLQTDFWLRRYRVTIR